MRHGWNATAYQIVNPGLKHWFARDGDGVIGYVLANRRRVVAGAPVCSEERLAEIIEEWTMSAKSTTCYFGATTRLHQILDNKQFQFSSVVLGAQPVWNPQTWSPERVPSLRQQFNRARNKGVIVEEWHADKAATDPSLRTVLRGWLDGRGLPPMHFLVEPETLDTLGDRRVFVATQNGEAMAFLVLAPIPTRNGWLTEEFPRKSSAPNGTVELLLDFAVKKVAAEGSTYVTMGLVPLRDFDSKENPVWLRALSRWVRAHGRRFYNFEGLEAFKSKFRPDGWEPIYVLSQEPRFSLRTLYAVTAAFTRTSPVVALAKGFGRAIVQELRWLRSKLR
jgi:phosphatidylglycerol lysyltransferase